MKRTVLAACLMLAAPSLTIAQDGRSVALILDSSGSMQARLENGERRIDAAKSAVAAFAAETADSVRLSLWAYGHQSHRSEKNCKDIEHLTAYAPIGENREEVVSKSAGLTAQGYTPISTILEMAANDLKSETGSASRAVVLVSDGKETCEGDPCAVAKALAEADADLVVHTIGFAVDVATRYELQCIAEMGRGQYFEAKDLDKLVESLSEAVDTAMIEEPAGIESDADSPGKLTLLNPSASNHPVVDSETGEEVASLGPTAATVELPGGIYSVRFGDAFWRGITVTPGETTEIETAIVDLPNASYRGHEIRDAETGAVAGSVSSSHHSINLMPSTFEIMFGEIGQRIVLEPGVRTVIPAGHVNFKGLPINFRDVLDADGRLAGSVSATGASLTLPPGSYTMEHDDRRYAFDIVDGQTLTVELQ